ncbi:MAG: DUF4173 domain-containing protein [Anaerolineaceae bacterium]|nr:DUF4173 domain-containing protein [Anaerolineaceae bacterium]
MKYKYRNLFWVLALVAAFSFDQLFWKQPGGINFFIFVIVTLICGLIPFWLEKIAIPWTSYILLAPVVYFALMLAFRTEPFTDATNGLITLGSVILFAMTLRKGNWVKFTLKDYLINPLKFGLMLFPGAILFFSRIKAENSDTLEEALEESEEGTVPEVKPKKPNKYAPYTRGVLLALPIIIIFTCLLASADPVFNSHIQTIKDLFKIENLGETVFRMTYIIVIAYIILSALYYGLVESEKLEASPAEKPMDKRFLGMIESGIILGAVNLLFLSFVILQFTYLFGGTDNINVEGFTYSEYAVRGFFELVAVAVISLVLFYTLSQETNREGKTQKWLFSGLGLLLIAQVGVMLVSAHTRLSLYEGVYGFTRLRTITHLFIFWLGILLLVAAILELTRKMYRLPLAVVLFIFGFGVTVNVVNLDRFITEQNIILAMNDDGESDYVGLDARHIFYLSYDSIPPLVEYYDRADLPEELHEEIGGILACRAVTAEPPESKTWYSWQASRATALSLLESRSEELKAEYLEYSNLDGWEVTVNGQQSLCLPYGYQDYD